MKIQVTRRVEKTETEEVEMLRYGTIPSWFATSIPFRCQLCGNDFHRYSETRSTCTVVETVAGPFLYHNECFNKARTE